MAKKNICKVEEGNNYIAFKARCNCLGNDHGQHIWIEIEEDAEIPMLYANFYYTLNPVGYWGSYWRRFKAGLCFIFGKHVDLEGDFIFDEEGLRDYIDSLESGYKKIKSRLNDIEKETQT